MPNGFYPTVSERIRSIKPKKRKELDEREAALVAQLLEVFDTPLREFVDQVVGLSTADRKALVTPFNELKKQLKKVFKPKDYSPPPRLQVKQSIGNYELVFGWLKNRHKYKEGDLLPPATDEELERLSAQMQEHNGEDFKITAQFVDAYRICNGMGDMVRMHDGMRFMCINEILECHEDFVARGLGHILPFGEDGTGNFYGLSGSEIVDVNHEDDSVIPVYKNLGTFLSKAHKVKRG
jgi:hypothetical protein